MRIQKIGLLLFYFSLCFNLSADTDTEEADRAQKTAVVSYINYLNQCSRLVHFSHDPAGEFNRTINQFVEQWDPEKVPELQQSYGVPLKLWHRLNHPEETKGHNQVYLMGDEPPIQHLNALFDEAVGHTSELPREYRTKLYNNLHKMERLMNRYFAFAKNLEKFTEKPEYLTRASIPDLYKELDSYSLMAFDFSALKYLMYQELITVYGEEDITSEMRELYVMTENIYQLVMSIRREDLRDAQSYYEIVEDIYYDSSLGSRLQDHAISLGYQDWKASRHYALLELTGFLMEYAEKYIQEKENWAAMPWYDEYGGSYFYGEKIMHYYNCPEGGVATFYNDIAAMEVGDQLMVVEEPMWFKVLKRRFQDEAEALPPAPAALPVVNRAAIGKNELAGYAANNLIFLIDVSASMKSPDKLPLLQQSLKQLVDMMRPEDHIAIVCYSGKAEVVMPSTSSIQQDVIFKAIDDLEIGGKTDGLEGIKIAYQHAEDSKIRGGNNRIILATDGKFDVDGRINRMIRKRATEEIYLSIFSFGERTNSGVRTSLKELVEFGKGNYAHLKEGEGVQETLLEEAKAVRK